MDRLDGLCRVASDKDAVRDILQYDSPGGYVGACADGKAGLYHRPTAYIGGFTKGDMGIDDRAGGDVYEVMQGHPVSYHDMTHQGTVTMYHRVVAYAAAYVDEVASA